MHTGAMGTRPCGCDGIVDGFLCGGVTYDDGNGCTAPPPFLLIVYSAANSLYTVFTRNPIRSFHGLQLRCRAIYTMESGEHMFETTALIVVAITVVFLLTSNIVVYIPNEKIGIVEKKWAL